MNPANTTLAVLQKNGISQNEYWSKRILEMIKLEKSNFVFSSLGTEVSIPLHEGTTTFTVRRYNHIPYDKEGKHRLTEGVPPTALKPEAHKVSGVVNQYGVVMEETDVAADVHFDNMQLEFLDQGYVVGGDIIRVHPLDDAQMKAEDIHVTYWFDGNSFNGGTIRNPGTYEITAEIHYPNTSMFMDRKIVATITILPE